MRGKLLRQRHPGVLRVVARSRWPADNIRVAGGRVIGFDCQPDGSHMPNRNLSPPARRLPALRAYRVAKLPGPGLVKADRAKHGQPEVRRWLERASAHRQRRSIVMASREQEPRKRLVGPGLSRERRFRRLV